MFDTSYPTPNSYIMCKFLFDLSITVTSDVLTGYFAVFLTVLTSLKKFDIFQKQIGISNLTIGTSFVDDSRLETSVVGF